jgi:hypothetical protein
MPFFTSSKSWGAQMSGARGVKSAKQAKADANKRNNPSVFKQRKAAAKGKGKRR